MEEINFYLQDAEESMLKALRRTDAELNKLRAGKAMPSMLDGIKVDYYGAFMPLNQVSNINTPDPRTLTVAPWDKSMLPMIEKAIKDANLGLNISKETDFIRVIVPVLTEERRKTLVKQAKAEAENGKVGVRNVRKEINEELRKLIKDGISEDDVKKAEVQVQKLTDSFIQRIEDILAVKEKDILTV